MSRSAIPFSINDISALARSLRSQLSECDHAPSHVELLNMLARAGGHRNFQSLRAQAAAQQLLRDPEPASEQVDFVLIKRLAGYFDAEGRLAKWPGKPSLQEPCLWVIWSKLASKQAMTEVQLSQIIRAQHLFGDHALLRRELVDRGLVRRTPDGKEYWRVERQPPAESLALIRHLGGGAQ
jgi:hypothetical protein